MKTIVGSNPVGGKRFSKTFFLIFLFLMKDRDWFMVSQCLFSRPSCITMHICYSHDGKSDTS